VYDLEVVLRTAASVLRLPSPFSRRRAWERGEAARVLAEASDRGGVG